MGNEFIKHKYLLQREDAIILFLIFHYSPISIVVKCGIISINYKNSTK